MAFAGAGSYFGGTAKSPPLSGSTLPMAASGLGCRGEWSSLETAPNADLQSKAARFTSAEAQEAAAEEASKVLKRALCSQADSGRTHNIIIVCI